MRPIFTPCYRMAQWARELGIDYRRLQSRINLGWDMDRIVAVGNRKANVSEIIRPTNYKKHPLVELKS